jgi:orotate phosphoribosyltransferase
MTDAERTLEILRQTGVLQEGHFHLSSGLHSDRYFQCALALQYPERTAELCSMLALRFKGQGVEVVVSPAVGGIVVGYELARQLGARAIFAEREEGRMTLRRGFALQPGERALVCEDVITTGGSAREVADLVRTRGAAVVGVAAFVDRSEGQAEFGAPFEALVSMQVPTFPPEACALCRQGVPVVKPGSRTSSP